MTDPARTDAGTYVYAACRPWNLAAFTRWRPRLAGNWKLVTHPDDLAQAVSTPPEPARVFLPHWSWKVPTGLLTRTPFIGFHMTDLPRGRGGSPLQNLIVRGYRDTVICALAMTAELDAGPVYLRRPLDLGGRAVDIFERAAEIMMSMIDDIIRTDPVPRPQTGAPEVWPRRTPDQSRLPDFGSIEAVHDHIRMLDAPGYPPAFLEHGAFRLTFDRAALGADGVTARVRIRPREESS